GCRVPLLIQEKNSDAPMVGAEARGSADPVRRRTSGRELVTLDIGQKRTGRRGPATSAGTIAHYFMELVRASAARLAHFALASTIRRSVLVREMSARGHSCRSALVR